MEQPLAPRNDRGTLTVRARGAGDTVSAYVVLKSLARRYDDVWAVSDLSLAIQKGESVALLGPSGCGKTTTLRMIAGLVAPTSGTIEVGGRDITQVPPHRRNLGYVFQSYALFPHMDVRANVAFGLEERRLARDEVARRVADALAQVRLVGLEARRPRALSGGQQQRVALARALAIQPDVLLLDESLSNLDAKLRDAMRLEIREIQKSSGVTTIFVTHDQTEALTLCDRVAVMNAGRIEQVASPREIYDRPATRFVAAFVGRSNQIAATRDAAGNPVLGGIAVKAPATRHAGRRDRGLPAAAADRAAAGRRIRRGRSTMRCPAGSRSVLFVGDRLEIAVETPAGLVMAEAPSTHDTPPAGTAVSVAWRPEDTLVFPRESAMMRPATASRIIALLLILPAALALAALYVGPMLGLGRMAFNQTGPTGAMVPAWSTGDVRRAVRRSFHLRDHLEFGAPVTGLDDACAARRLSARAVSVSHALALPDAADRARHHADAGERRGARVRLAGAARRPRPGQCGADGHRPDQRAAAPGVQLFRRHHRARREPDALHDPGAAVGLRPSRCDGRGGGREPRRARRGACSGA